MYSQKKIKKDLFPHLSKNVYACAMLIYLQPVHMRELDPIITSMAGSGYNDVLEE